MPHPILYGFDLCTDTTSDAIDPASNRITTIGVSTAKGEEVFAGDEAEMLKAVDRFIEQLGSGILVTWQGAGLDLPLLSIRASHHHINLGMRLRPERRGSAASMLLGVDQPVCGMWHDLQHLELRQVYETSSRWWRSSKGKLDPESMIPPVDPLTPHRPERDARLARTLAERRWSQARRHLDRRPVADDERRTSLPSILATQHA